MINVKFMTFTLCVCSMQESLQIKISHEEVGRVKCQTQLNECRGNLEETKIKCERLETSLTQTVEEVEQEKKNCISLQVSSLSNPFLYRYTHTNHLCHFCFYSYL